MIVGCGEWGFRNLPMEEHFQIAQAFGFRILEFGIGGGQTGRLPETPTGRDIHAFRSLSETYQIATPFCCLENDFTLNDPVQHGVMVEKVIGQIDFAAECGATHIRIFAGFTPADQMNDDIWDRMIDAVDQCDQRCQSNGLKLAIETHGAIAFDQEGAAIHTHTITTEPEALKRLIHILPPTVGFNYDPGNLKAVCPEDRNCRLDLLNERINYCHLKDWRKFRQGWEACAIGDDDLDYSSLFDQMLFDGVYLIEYEPLGDTETGISRSLDYLRRIAGPLQFGANILAKSKAV